jgi:uncharacterized protein YndB with AHSA1/START domain
MSVNELTFNAPPQAVWDVLSDGWLYPLWVVGATRMRDVDENWPEVGSKIHHSAGVWPVVVNDYTEVLESAPLRQLVLRARGWPMGEAKVVLELEAVGGGTLVRIVEDAVAGPGRLVPDALMQPMLAWRNTETLRRLAFVVEGRAN